MQNEIFSVEAIADKIRKSAAIVVENDAEYVSYRTMYKSDPDLVKSFAEMVKKYGLWGWCQVTVRVTYKGLESAEYLGGCSYKSEKDFVKNSGYYEDMVNDCINNIAHKIKDLVSDL